MNPNSNQAPKGALPNPPPMPVSYGSYGPQPAAVNPPMAGPQPSRPQNYQAFTPMAQAQANPGAPAPPPMKRTNPNSTQNMLQIAEIRDGLVIMNDGSFRSLVMARSINFDLMSPDERESIEYAYQGFLNSLHFPVQIFVRTERVDLRPYLERLDKIRREQDNMLLALLMEDYLAYIDDLASQTNIMDKKFYLVVPYFPVASVQKAITQSKNFFTGIMDMFNTKEKRVTINEAELNAAKTELRERVQSVLAGLQQAGIKALPLDTQELIELYYDVYNPDTATRQQLKQFDLMSAPVITKGQGEAQQPNLNREIDNNG